MNTPKFKKGDWIKRKKDGHIARIVMLLKTCYDLELTDGEGWWLDYDFQDNWELTDAPPKNKLIDSFQQEQPDVDLDADIEMEWDSFKKHLAEYGEESEEVIWLNYNSFKDVAQSFFNLGLLSK